MDISFPPFTSSAARVTSVVAPSGTAARGVSLAQAPLAWPARAAGETLDYALDLDAWLAEIDDDVAAATAAVVLPGGFAADPADAAPMWVTVLSGRPVVMLSGGVPGRSYGVLVSIRTVAGRTARFLASAPVLTWDAATPALPPRAIVGDVAPLLAGDGAALLLAPGVPLLAAGGSAVAVLPLTLPSGQALAIAPGVVLTLDVPVAATVPVAASLAPNSLLAALDRPLLVDDGRPLIVA